MAAAESAVSESEKKWEGFKETAEKIKGDLRANIQSLTEAIEEVRGVCNEFFKEYHDKIPSKSEEIQTLPDKLNQMVVILEDELKKALSEDIAIVFVGRTSSGKSSLINALLQDNRLPVKKVKTTMSKIQVRPTANEEWSVVKVGCEKPLSDQMSEEDVKALLSMMSGEINAAERKKLNIDSQSVIQVNWPRHLCTLPENVVLIDTPGCSESTGGNKVVLGSNKEAHILVAVMDIMSPSIEGIAQLVNGVDCDFKFGVFTKWDKNLLDKEEGEEAAGQRQQIRAKHEQDFRKYVNEERCKVYFVDAKHHIKAKETPQGIDGRNDFLKFVTDLAQSAKSVKANKGLNLIKRAEDLTSKRNEDFKRMKSILEQRRKCITDDLKKITSEISTLNVQQCSLDAVNQQAKKLIDLLRRHLDDGEINRLIKELGNKIESCDTVESEDEAIAAFEEKIHGINRALQLQTEKVEKEYNDRKGSLECLQTKFPKQFLQPYEAKEPKTAEDCGYRSIKDPYAYVTSNNVWKFLLGCAAATAAAAAAPTIIGVAATASAAVAPTLALAATKPEAAAAAATTAATAAAAVPTLVEKLSGFGVGQTIRRLFGPSKSKVNKVTQLAFENLMGIKTECRKCEVSLSEGIKMIAKSSSEIKKENDRLSGEKLKLRKDLNQLKEWSKKLTESTKRLQEVQNELNKLKPGLKGENTVPLDDQTENQSPVRRPKTQIKKGKFS